MKKSFLFPLLALTYLVLVVACPSLYLRSGDPECEILSVSSYSFGDLLLEAKSNADLFTMVFALSSGALFIIMLLFTSRILIYKRVYRLIFVPISIYTIYSLVLFNHHIFETVSKKCYELNFIYPIFSLVTTLFFLLGIYLIFAKTKNEQQRKNN